MCVSVVCVYVGVGAKQQRLNTNEKKKERKKGGEKQKEKTGGGLLFAVQ